MTVLAPMGRGRAGKRAGAVALALAGLFLAATSAFAASRGPSLAMQQFGLRPSQDDLPCGIGYDRTVTPGTIKVNESVHVRITVNGSCTTDSRGLDIFFVVDRSVTMFDKSYMNPTKDALQNFVNAMDFSKSMAGLITYAAGEQVNQPLTSERDNILLAIDHIRLNEENDVRALPAAFRSATQLLDRDGIPGNEKIVLVIAAGPDVNNALVNMPTVTQAARNAGVKVIFLMFPDARYTHYVEASSDCTGTHCQTWQGPRGGTMTKWAWAVDQNTIDSVLQNLIPLLARSLAITDVTIEDILNSGANLVAGSVRPPQSGSTEREIIWSQPSIPPEGLVLEYDATMIYEDETYPVTDVSELAVTYNDGSPTHRRPLPNPDIIVVSDVPTITPTGPVPTVSATPSATATQTQLPPPPGEMSIYLPMALRGEL